MGVFSSNDPTVTDPEATPFADAADADADVADVTDDTDVTDDDAATVTVTDAKSDAVNVLGDQDAVNAEYNPNANAPEVPTAQAVRRYPDAYPQSVVDELSRDPRELEDDDDYNDDVDDVDDVDDDA